MGHPFYVVTINLKVKEVKEENEELQIEENRTAIYMQMINALAKHLQTCGKVAIHHHIQKYMLKTLATYRALAAMS